MADKEFLIENVGTQRAVAKSGNWTVWCAMNLVISLFFLLAAYVNLNDTDWYIWVPLYGVPALLSLPLVVKPEWSTTKIWNMVTVVHLTICLAYGVYQVVVLIEILSGKVQNPLQHEEGRETFGLLIIVTWLIIARFTNIGRPAGTSNKYMMNALLLMTVTLTFIPLLVWSLCFVSDWHTKLSHCNGMFDTRL